MCSGTLENPRIEQLITYLSEQLNVTTGKKQYGYLRPPLKAAINEIIAKLEKEPCIAATYDLWYRQWEEVLRTYKDDLPPQLPLSQQKKFKRIKNMVIKEAVRLGDELDISIQPKPTVDQGTTRKPDRIVHTVTRLLHHMGNIFQNWAPLHAGGISFVASNLRRRIREKKIAMDHKADDHERQNIQQFR